MSILQNKYTLVFQLNYLGRCAPEYNEHKLAQGYSVWGCIKIDPKNI